MCASPPVITLTIKLFTRKKIHPSILLHIERNKIEKSLHKNLIKIPPFLSPLNLDSQGSLYWNKIVLLLLYNGFLLLQGKVQNDLQRFYRDARRWKSWSSWSEVYYGRRGKKDLEITEVRMEIGELVNEVSSEN